MARRLCAAEDAVFAVGDWAALQPMSRFAVGQPDYPDRSRHADHRDARAVAPNGARLTGPGIATTAQLSLPETVAFQANRALFPLGFDAFLTCGAQVAGLPRSTHVEA